ncbi:MAG: 3-methyl-2-oxobutanoate hydroxymethyltransferase [Tepidisphaeraceae bacterium]
MLRLHHRPPARKSRREDSARRRLGVGRDPRAQLHAADLAGLSDRTDGRRETRRPNTLVMGDLPFGSYQSAGETAINNACEMVKRSGCDAVKIEVSEYHLGLVNALAQAGVAVVAHLGLRPQAVGMMGGYKFQGRTVDEANHIVKQAQAFAHAGAAAILLEAVPGEVGQKVVDEVDVPVIGCGGGPACHSHVVVLQDLLRQTPRQPKFVPHIELSGDLTETAARYVKMIESGAYPTAAHGYTMPDDQRRLFLRDTAVV